jgi:hypothetical protein
MKKGSCKSFFNLEEYRSVEHGQESRTFDKIEDLHLHHNRHEEDSCVEQVAITLLTLMKIAA